MTRGRIAIAITLAAALILAACNDGKQAGYQGWIEAELIFVSPDEPGRIETLAVREGDHGRPARAAVHPRCRSAAGRRRDAGSAGEERAAGL